MKICPSCGRLVHAAQLTELAQQATAAESGQPSFALEKWRHVLELLPSNTVQAQEVHKRIDELVRTVDSMPQRPETPPPPSGRSMPVRMIAPLALLAWKFKWIAALLLTKGKLVLFGLTKVSTLASMGVWILAYAVALGWRFAVGLAVVIYIHEMGHVFALQRLGIRAAAPVFIPGIGAIVRLRQSFVNPLEDARVGLAGPLWGLAAAITTALLYAATGYVLFGALTQVGAWINLFNLLPIGPLDGGRGFRALSRRQRVLLLLLMLGVLLITGEGLLVLILIVGGLRTISENPSKSVESWRTLAEFSVLIVALSALAAFHNLAETGIIGGPN
jgi:Zn-dependent protease